MLELSVVTLVDNRHLGRDANARAVQQQLTCFLAQTQGYRVHQREVTPETYQQFMQDLPNETARMVVVGAGEDVLPALAQIKKMAGEGATVAWASHQVPDTLPLMTDAERLDVAAVPINAPNKEQLSTIATKIVETRGVAHQLTVDTIKEQYHSMQDSLPLNDKYLVVALAGDSTGLDGHIRHYTPEEAQQLGYSLGQRALLQGSTVLATNGARTGAYDPQTGERTTAHTAQASGLDPVSSAFCEGLRAAGLPEDRQMFVDYQFQNPASTAQYQAMLGAALLNPESEVFMPGESITMLSEALSVIPNDRVFVYRHHGMNASHHAAIDSLQQQTAVRMTPEQQITSAVWQQFKENYKAQSGLIGVARDGARLSV
jgi:hypothetical protein